MDDAYLKELKPIETQDEQERYDAELDEDALVTVADVDAFDMPRIQSQRSEKLRYRHPISLETVDAVLTHEPDIQAYFTDPMEEMDSVSDDAPYAYLEINAEGTVRTIGLGVAEDDPYTGKIFDGRLDRSSIRQDHLPTWVPDVEAALRGYAEQGALNNAWEARVRDPLFSLTPSPTRYF